MIQLRTSEARGHFDHGWLDTRHTFSFADYFDPGHMGFHSLRVINEDRVQPGKGFGTHPHRDMEIVSVVVSGSLKHRDSMGNGSVILPGEVQRMTAGTGITHSEFNGSKEDPVHFLQIWILPERTGLQPGYEQRAFPPETRRRRLLLVASRDGREGSVTVHQDASIFVSDLGPGDAVEHAIQPGRHAWVQVILGGLRLNGQELCAGDGASTSGEERLVLESSSETEFLLFDLA
jgi:redox-sensitive bicupin YhaK (pirin superfamily)